MTATSGTTGTFNYNTFKKEWDQMLESKRYRDAEKLCNDSLAFSPMTDARGRLYNNLGFLYENHLEDKTFDDILEMYVLSLQVDESNADSHFNLANFLLEQGMQHLLRALELKPKHPKGRERYKNLTPIEAGTTLDLSGQKYQVLESTDNGVLAARLRKRADGGYERVDGQPQSIGISDSVKVYPSSGSTNDAYSRTDNLAANDAGTSGGKNSCCFRCVLYWWWWALLWILGVGGVAVPVLGYLWFAEEECSSVVTSTSTVALNTDTDTQGHLNVLFVVSCALSSYSAQFDAIGALLQEMTDGVTIDYEIQQYCSAGGESYISSINNATNGGTGFAPFDATETDINLTDYAQDNGGDGAHNLASALSLCQDTLSALDDSTPLLCVPFVSHEFDDVFESMHIAAQSEFADIYLAFMVDANESDFDASVYSVLGSFASATECIARIEDDDAFGNTWWASKLACDVDASSAETVTCAHCINYATDASVECAANELQSIFEGEGVTEEKLTTSDTQECSYTYTAYYFYCIGAVIPLLIWVMITMFVLCCKSCRSKSNE